MNITLIPSTVHPFNEAAINKRLLSSSVRNMDILPETPMAMPQPSINSKGTFGLTVVISVTRKQPRLFPKL